MASYRGVRGSSSVIVVPTGTYRLTGKVLESGLPVQGALVKITSGQGSGLSRSTGFAGDYQFYGVAWTCGRPDHELATRRSPD